MGPNTRRVLVRAKELLIEHGWTQGTERDRDGHYCLTGAIRAACSELGYVTNGQGTRDSKRYVDMAMWAIMDAAAPLARFQTAQAVQNLTLWNDFLAHSLEQAVGLIDRTLET